MRHHRTLGRTSAALVLVALLAGCSLTTLPTTSGGNKSGGSTTTAGGGTTPVHNQPLEPLNGLDFKPITAANSRFLAANGNSLVAAGGGNLGGNAKAGVASNSMVSPTGAAVAAPAAAPMAQSADSAVVSGGVSARVAAPAPPAGPANGPGGAVSGNVDSYYGYNSYFGNLGFGGDQQMALVSVRQAETNGSAGTFSQIVSSVAAPVVKVWASDARLIHSSAMLDNKGSTVANGEGNNVSYNGGMNLGDGWSFTYVSASRSEVLTFAVSPSKTTVLRMRWEPLNLAPERVTTDSSAAIQKLINAIQDKNFQSEEEKSHKDYFQNYDFTQVPTGAYDGGGQTTEVVYQVPPDAHWNVDLQEIMGKLVWDLNFYGDPGQSDGVMSGSGYIGAPAIGIATAAGPAPTKSRTLSQVAMPILRPYPPAPCGAAPTFVDQPGWFNNSARGMVDAETGTVIRFTRPTRVHFRNQVGVTCPATPGLPPSGPLPTPMPLPQPSAAPSAAPTTTPTPKSTSTP